VAVETSVENVNERAAPDIEPERAPRHYKAMIVVFIMAALLATGGYFFWKYSETYESTDDAQVDAHMVGVSSRIQGTVTAVHAEENQFVKKGQVLVEIDPRDYQMAVAQARADLAQANAGIQVENPNIPITETSSQTAVSTTQADVANATAAVAAAQRDMAAAEARLREVEANNVKAQADVVRYRALVEKDEVAREQYDTVAAAAKAQAAAVDSARASAEAGQKVVDQRRAQLAQAESRLSMANRNAPHQVAASRANVQLRQASANAVRVRLDKALLDLSYTTVTAPVDGAIGQRSVEVGATVQPGQQLFTIAQLSDLWVTANFKETQLKRMRSGQRVTISVDAFGRDFSGYVESMPAATGAITSLLPPENATGNYVKVVQRLPVRIRFNKDQQGLDRLRPGMSVVPKVWL
jgi:membrane fusion protein, multidrug efflux system